MQPRVGPRTPDEREIAEGQRIRRFFSREYAIDWSDRTWHWHPRHPNAVYHRAWLELRLIEILNDAELELPALDILDVGSETGRNLRFFVELGAQPERLSGIDLVPERIADAKRMNPAIRFEVGNATELPHDSDTFDMVTQSAAFSAITDLVVRSAAAREVDRVLRPGGHLLWHDLSFQQPPAKTRAVALEDLIGLFPDYETVGLRPIFHRWTPRLLPRSARLCALLETLPLPSTNLVALLRKPGMVPSPA
jgi:ubiquinone/menaquinone biosynthesis C-methylase UbiE